MHEYVCVCVCVYVQMVSLLTRQIFHILFRSNISLKLYKRQSIMEIILPLLQLNNSTWHYLGKIFWGLKHLHMKWKTTLEIPKPSLHVLVVILIPNLLSEG